MISRTSSIVERLVAEVVCHGVDAEGALLDDEEADDACVDGSAFPVSLTYTLATTTFLSEQQGTRS